MDTVVQSRNAELMLWRSGVPPLPLAVTDCSLEWTTDEWTTDVRDTHFTQETQNSLKYVTIQCTLSLERDQQPIRDSWFNLSPEAQKAESIPSFYKDIPIQLDLALSPNLLEQWDSAIATPQNAIAHLQELSRKHAEENLTDIHPLLQEQNWYCTRIKQHQPIGEICYHTLWHYLLPALQNPTSESIANSITPFIQDQTTDSLKQITAATDPLFQDIAQTFQDLFTNALSDLESDNSDFGERSNDSGSAPLVDAVTEFLDSEEWPYAQVPDVSANTIALRLAFRGEQGQWPCYCNINQEQQTVCFYSISPMTAEPEHCGAIAHFLTRANYGMILGNFELDFRDGEIRYKTSIDVEGDRLTPALVQNLLYTNVMTMDQYLPGILAILEQGMSPEDAIYLVEDQAVTDNVQA